MGTELADGLKKVRLVGTRRIHSLALALCDPYTTFFCHVCSFIWPPIQYCSDAAGTGSKNNSISKIFVTQYCIVLAERLPCS